MTPPRIVPVPSGEDLLPALAAIEPDCWLQANGHVEGVELKLPGEATDLTRTLRGRLVLVSLHGPSGGPYTVALARHSDVGIEILGGQLTRARSQGVSLFVQPAGHQAPREPGVRREVVAVVPTASPPSPPPTSSAATQAPPTAPPRTWAEVAAASEAAEEEEGDSLPERGDLVDHFAFGLCDVIKADGDRLQIRDVRGSGRIREVVVSALRVMPPKQQNGKRCFRLQRRN